MSIRHNAAEEGVLCFDPFLPVEYPQLLVVLVQDFVAKLSRGEDNHPRRTREGGHGYRGALFDFILR